MKKKILIGIIILVVIIVIVLWLTRAPEERLESSYSQAGGNAIM